MVVHGDLPLGCSALLRVGGLPVRFWLLGANPALFSKFERLEREERQRAAHGIRLAEQVGRELVPNPVLSREERAFLLALRRSLHRGDSLANVARERLLAIPVQSASDADLVRAIVATIDRDQQLVQLASDVAAACGQEEERLFRLPEQIYAASPVARALFTSDEVALNRRTGQSEKQRRHHFEHAWRRLTRASTGSTPRGWLSHVALLALDGATSSPPTLTDQFSAQWTANVRRRRLELSAPPADWPHDDSLLAINPLHWYLNEHLVTVVLDQTDEPAQVTVRRTPLLADILAAFTGATCTFSRLAAALDCQRQDELAVLREFVRHLVVLGILQPSAPPDLRLGRTVIPGESFMPLPSESGAPIGWVDVYRYAESGIPPQVVEDVQRGVTDALCLLELMRSAEGYLEPPSMLDTGREWSFSEILRAELEANGSAVPVHAIRAGANDWPRSIVSDSAYHRLLAAIAEEAERGSDFNVGEKRFAAGGAGDEELDWPVDCLVRLADNAADYTAVLDQIWPPGILDARFADTLVDLHGVVPQQDAYRVFLQHLEALTGVLFVELLAPPLSDGAANAVRRPIYTHAWTGDPDAATYVRQGTEPGRYIPLSAIRLRRSDGRLLADVDGQVIWPVHHATRSFSPPWDRLARVLLATVPITMPWDYQRMIRSLTHSIEHPRQPRILTGGGIVLSPAQWRLPLDELWEQSAPTPEKIRALIRLRRRYSLPRWVQLMPGDGKALIPCDLESIQAIRSIERYAKTRGLLHLSEMLPTPDQFVVRDRAHRPEDRLAAQLQLRLPCDESALAMATRVAPKIRSALGLASATRRAPAVPARGRGPPLPAANHQ